MRGDDAEGSGTRGRLGETQRVAANSGAASALAREVQSNGAAQILAADARRSSSGELCVKTLRETEGKGGQRTRGVTGFRKNRKGAAMDHW